jgi:hypothetical protein
MSRNKIGKQAVQQGFSNRSRRLLHNLGLTGVVSKGFVDKVKSILGTLALGRKTIEAGEAYQLREPSIPYSAHFGVKKGDIGPENTYFSNVNL